MGRGIERETSLFLFLNPTLTAIVMLRVECTLYCPLMIKHCTVALLLSVHNKTGLFHLLSKSTIAFRKMHKINHIFGS